jgi:hypothetical protein
LKAALRTKNYIVISAQIDNGSVVNFAPPQIALLERFKVERIGLIEDAQSLGSGMTNEIPRPTKCRSGLGNMVGGFWGENSMKQRRGSERVNVRPDEIGPCHTMFQHPLVVVKKMPLPAKMENALTVKVAANGG